jgi:hypothetical protein
MRKKLIGLFVCHVRTHSKNNGMQANMSYDDWSNICFVLAFIVILLLLWKGKK